MFQISFKLLLKQSEHIMELNLSKSCQRLFSSLGIRHQKTVSYSPQQNGRVERKHHHLLQVARALFSQSNLPIHLWGHTILMATYIINLLPTKNFGMEYTIPTIIQTKAFLFQFKGVWLLGFCNKCHSSQN